MIFAASSFGGEVLWSGWWMLITVVCAAVYIPFRFHRDAEVDERFDGIVYSVALGLATATGFAEHLYGLRGPGVVLAVKTGLWLVTAAVGIFGVRRIRRRRRYEAA